MTTSVKQTWTRDDTVLVSRCYLDGKSLQETQALMPGIKFSALKTKLANCLYLDKKDSKSKNVSKLHQDVWDELKTALTVPDVEAVSVPEDAGTGGYWDEPEADGEEYFMCTGNCERVFYFEDTDADGMCGKCQYENERKSRNRNRK